MPSQQWVCEKCNTAYPNERSAYLCEEKHNHQEFRLGLAAQLHVHICQRQSDVFDIRHPEHEATIPWLSRADVLIEFGRQFQVAPLALVELVKILTDVEPPTLYEDSRIVERIKNTHVTKTAKGVSHGTPQQ